jgi:8-oxo-dGTP pyrophosphatase MutT (NUDIX family)
MDSFVEGIVMDYQMDRFLLIDKGGMSTKHGPFLKWQGFGGKFEQHKGVLSMDIYNEIIQKVYETPHECMEREFSEETGILVKKSRWHCFFIKQYSKVCKLYNFVVFASPDEMNRIRESSNRIKNNEGKVDFHTLVDVYWDPQLYTFDVPYRIQMIIREMKMGMFIKLDPEGVNTSGKVP